MMDQFSIKNNISPSVAVINTVRDSLTTDFNCDAVIYICYPRLQPLSIDDKKPTKLNVCVGFFANHGNQRPEKITKTTFFKGLSISVKTIYSHYYSQLKKRSWFLYGMNCLKLTTGADYSIKHYSIALHHVYIL